jgi:hypothetical protein
LLDREILLLDGWAVHVVRPLLIGEQSRAGPSHGENKCNSTARLQQMLQMMPNSDLVIQKNVELGSRNTKKAWQTGDRAGSGSDFMHFKQAIDRWRSTEPDTPSRSEAIRWLISQGLTAELTKRTK